VSPGGAADRDTAELSEMEPICVPLLLLALLFAGVFFPIVFTGSAADSLLFEGIA
jgi:hypothetical protein